MEQRGAGQPVFDTNFGGGTSDVVMRSVGLSTTEHHAVVILSLHTEQLVHLTYSHYGMEPAKGLGRSETEIPSTYTNHMYGALTQAKEFHLLVSRVYLFAFHLLAVN